MQEWWDQIVQNVAETQIFYVKSPNIGKLFKLERRKEKQTSKQKQPCSNQVQRERLLICHLRKTD